MNMYKLFLLCSMFVCASAFSYVEKKALVSAIQFPKTIKNAPYIRMYYRGGIVKGDVDNEGKKIVYRLSEKKHLNFFYLCIVKAQDLDCIKPGNDPYSNTVQHFKIKPHKPYKLYSLEMVGDSAWRVKQEQLPFTTGLIPDDAMILCYNPHYIAKVAGGSEIELPKVYIKEGISEATLADTSTELLLSCLDFDTLHNTVQQVIKQDISQKTVVALDI